MLENPEKVIAIAAVGSGICLMMLAIAGFFLTPAYKDLVDMAAGAFKDVFLVSAGVKAGLAIPKKDKDA